MKQWVICLSGLLFLLFAQLTEGGIQLRARMDRDTFLLYESLPVVVSIRNQTGQAISLDRNDGHSPLSFVITDGVGSLVQQLGALLSDELLTVAPGETVTRSVNLLPLYDLRARGTYRVQAIIDAAEWRSSAAPVSFSIIGGRKIWTDTVGIPPQGEAEMSSRQYTLLTRRDDQYDLLYVSVQDQTKDLVYGMVPLGIYIAMGDPEVQADKLGNLHVLFRAGPRAFVYAGIGPDARLLDTALYTDETTYLPHLFSEEDGSVIVVGGVKVSPKEESGNLENGETIDARFKEDLKGALENKIDGDASALNSSEKPAPITNFTTRSKLNSSKGEYEENRID